MESFPACPVSGGWFKESILEADWFFFTEPQLRNRDKKQFDHFLLIYLLQMYYDLDV
jgi:hypothetical protein